jgi:hypothetical protein
VGPAFLMSSFGSCDVWLAGEAARTRPLLCWAGQPRPGLTSWFDQPTADLISIWDALPIVCTAVSLRICSVDSA